jgi:predicted RNA-binding Zn ribbon-like protein
VPDGQVATEPRAGTAPGDLATVQRFVNTLDIEQGSDELTEPRALAGWLAAAGLLDMRAAARTSVADVEQALRLREALRGVLRSHAGHGTAAAAAAEMNAVAAGLRVSLAVAADGTVRSVAADQDTRGALASILLIAAEAATLGTWSRLKACSADDCQWAFYDRSPTRNGCWCSMRICGSRAKSRSYRQRAGAGRAIV